MKTTGYLRKKLKSFAARVLFEQEGVVLEFTEQIVEAMERKEMTRAQIAERLGVSRAHVTQILRGDNNFTFQTAVSLAVAVGLRFKVLLEDEEENSLREQAEAAARLQALTEMLDAQWAQFDAIREGLDEWALVGDESLTESVIRLRQAYERLAWEKTRAHVELAP